MPAVRELPFPQLHLWKVLIMRDGFGREITYLRLSVTDRCNLRCRYCMPEEGVSLQDHEEMLTQEEMLAAVEAAASLGITKLRITGGEPLVKKNILSICRQCAQVEGIREVCITTNGLLLPQLAEPLRDAGVSRVNISLDTLDGEKYRRITRVGEMSQALAGIEAALKAGFEKVKLNVVLIGGFNDDEIPALAELTRRWPVDVRFIELMPMTEGFPQSAFIPCTAVLERLPELEPVSGRGGTARLYRLPGGMGNVGLISPVSDHFCASCDRLRLTADGKVKPCLHAETELSLKGLSREEMVRQLKEAILAKPRCHEPLSHAQPSRAGRDMNQIGG